MLNARFIPIDKWPFPAISLNNKRDARFRASYQDTLELLESELDAIHAREIVIRAFFRSQDIRSDGWPRSSAEPTDAGLILSFVVYKWNPVTMRNDVTELSFPCATYTTFDDNLRAIALTLQALRAVARYCTLTMEFICASHKKEFCDKGKHRVEPIHDGLE